MRLVTRALSALSVVVALVATSAATVDGTELAPAAPVEVAADGDDATTRGRVLAAVAPEPTTRELLRELRATQAIVVAVPEPPPALEPAPEPAPVPAPVAAAPAPPPPAPPAPPSAPVRSRSDHREVGRQALARLQYLDISGLGWTIEFHPGRDGYLGISDAARKRVDIYVRDEHTVEDITATLAHELMHVIDVELFTDDQREEWQRRRGLSGSWWPDCTCDDRDFGAGDLAEAAVILEVGHHAWTGRNGRPTQTQIDWLAAQLS